VEKDAKFGEFKLTTGEKPASGGQEKFVRRLREPPKVLDLLDIVAGGNGLHNRRERGIDAATGMQDMSFMASYRNGTCNHYQSVAWHKFIDGVFIPDGKAGEVQVDSLGHKFDGFSNTNGRVFGSIWARAAEVQRPDLAKNGLYWVYAIGEAKQFMPAGRGLLCIHPNAGITFDLDAIRQAHGVSARQFCATVGMADARRFGVEQTEERPLKSDVWILVDGQLKWSRKELGPDDPPTAVRVELGRHDRFLTLVTSAYLSAGDCVVIGDPALDFSAAWEEQKEQPPMEQ
jgi:hypothetical protein